MSRKTDAAAGIAIVAIGRNEGARLQRCLESAIQACPRVVYVDSGSTDGSADRAKELGCEVEELDPVRPFSAARARNEGTERVRRCWPGVELVQFVDGDCELDPGWLQAAARHLESDPSVAVVCGQRREQNPRQSIYNLLTDLEWDDPPGPVRTFRGDALVRVEAFLAVGGFRADLIAGEEPELCVRLRRAGWRVLRIPQLMTTHDARLHHFSQWWRRQVRSGHAYMESVWLQWPHPEPYWLRKLASIGSWNGLWLGVFLGAIPSGGASLWLLAIPVLLWSHIFFRQQRRLPMGAAAAYASACVIGKVAELQGILTYLWNRRIRHRTTPLIEYKRNKPRTR